MANLTPLLLNNVASTVQAGSSAIGSATATGVNVATGDGANFGTIGTNQYIPAVIVDTSTSPETVKEYVYVTARSTDALTVTRQAEESSRYAASTTSIQAGYTIAAVATPDAQRRNFSVMTIPPVHHGFLTSVCDPLLATASASFSNAGWTFATLLAVPYAMVVSKVCLRMTTAVSTPTSGQNFVAVYGSDGTLLGSGDATTAFGGTGWLQVSLSASITITPNAVDGFVYAAFQPKGAAGPTVNCVTTSGADTVPMVANRYRSCKVQTTQTALPSPLPVTGGANFFAAAQTPWMALA